MAAQKRASVKDDPLAQAAVEHFASRSHNAWRQNFLMANPGEKGKPRMRMRGGVMVDINQPWARLDPKAKADNTDAAYDAFLAVQKFPNDREAAADEVHKSWIKRNKSDPNQPKDLFKPYARLPEVEKDKDRAHVDAMKAALAAVKRRRKAAKPRKSAKSVRPAQTPQVDAKQWARLEKAAQRLSARLGTEVSAQALMGAGLEAMIAVCGSLEASPRRRKS